MSESIWQVVAEVNGVLEASALIGRLHAEDIPAQTEEIGPNTAFPMTVGRLGMVRIYVPEEFVEQAVAIVEHDYTDDLDKEFDEYDDEFDEYDDEFDDVFDDNDDDLD